MSDRKDFARYKPYFDQNNLPAGLTEKEKADRYFQSRVILQLPAEYWVMNISAFATTQTLLKKTI